jgi:hypothetical protein
VPVIFNKMLKRKSKRAWAFSTIIGSTVKVVTSSEAREVQKRERDARQAARRGLVQGNQPDSSSQRPDEASAETDVTDGEDNRSDGENDDECDVVEIGLADQIKVSI